MPAKSIRNFFTTKHEKLIQTEYEKKGYHVYYSKNLFGGIRGIPDFWITTKEYGCRIGWLILFGARSFLLSDANGFFVECKGKHGYINPVQVRMFNKLASGGYRVLIHRENNMAEVWKVEEKGIMLGYPN